jgi:nucleoside-diphosphate-sugar epimerase
MQILIVGGTRNLGHILACHLLGAGHRVTVLNRGITPDELPAAVERLHADRRDRTAMAQVLGGRRFHAVVDFALYTAEEAAGAVELFAERTSHFVFVSSGQVYLVRTGVGRPYQESEYDGRLMSEPRPGTPDHEEWQYGVGKRGAEDVFAEAARDADFPVTILRLPMVHSERDHHHRIEAYVARLGDGGPILLPEGPHLDVRHVDGADVVRGIRTIVEGELGKGRAYNLSQDTSYAIDDVLKLIARAAGRTLRTARLPRAALQQAGLLPACSPFSERWMSSLDNRLAKDELGLSFTPFPVTIDRLVRHAVANPGTPPGYEQRARELSLAGESLANA